MVMPFCAAVALAAAPSAMASLKAWKPDFAALLKDGARMKQIAQGTYGRRKTGAACAVGNLADYVTRLGKANFGEDWRLEEWA